MGLLLEILFELILQIGGELLFEVVLGRLWRYSWVRETLATAIGLVLYFGLGILAGFLTLLIFPHPFVRSSRMHGISLVITPVLAGLLMAGIGRLKRRHGLKVMRLDTFVYACVFAFGMSLIRFMSAT